MLRLNFFNLIPTAACGKKRRVEKKNNFHGFYV